DQTRSTRESEEEILEAIKWLGLPWDEGPDVGGPCGPYRQSERTDIYREHCQRLVESGGAYPCFCTQERLAELRLELQSKKSAMQGYDGLCAKLTPEEAQKRIDAGESHVIRLKVPESGECVLKDRFRDEVRIPWNTVDHQILLKADGFPTYHLANVVDDHLMGITHVLRGEEWISSTPKHLMLYQQFGWDPPEFGHLPLLRNPYKSKLSKRKNPTGILYYKQAGILPEVLLNYLGLMAYSMPDGSEKFTLDEFVADFDIDRISLGGPVFDLKKLTNFNGNFIRELSPQDILARLQGWMLNDQTWLSILELARTRVESLSDILPASAYLFADKVSLSADNLIQQNMDGAKVAELMKIAQWELETLVVWDKETIRGKFDKIAATEDIKLKDLMVPFFVALSGSKTALPIFESMVILGREMSTRRLQYALDALDTAGFSMKGKALKQFTTDYESKYK
ncbi:MAG: glutamate--tRNA ligase, partial [Lentisphaerae bacterium]|nr:glutamate--tRNA ligase [Lentisphaerota bacterium]